MEHRSAEFYPKYYSKGDMSLEYNFNKSANIISEFDEGKEYSPSDIIGLWNVSRIIDALYGEGGLSAKRNRAAYYLDISQRAKKLVQKYINTTKMGVYGLVRSVPKIYLDDLIFLMANGCYLENINKGEIVKIVKYDRRILWYLCKNKKIVDRFEDILIGLLKDGSDPAGSLYCFFIEDEQISRKMSDADFNDVLIKYATSEGASPLELEGILKRLNFKNHILSRKFKTIAKERIDSLNKRAEDLIRMGSCSANYYIELGNVWLDKSSYGSLISSILANGALFDSRGNLLAANSISERKSLVDFLKNKDEFSEEFELYQSILTCLMEFFVKDTKKTNIRLESVYKWFFEEYLLSEYGFSIKTCIASSASSYVEKCRSLACEIDGILCQYDLYASTGAIPCNRLMWGDFRDRGSTRSVCGDNSISIAKGGSIEDLSPAFRRKLSDMAIREIEFSGYTMLNSADLRTEASKERSIRLHSMLFTGCESLYLEYWLDHKKFNGRNIRNRYAHSSYSLEIKEQRKDYIILLSIYLLIISAIIRDLSNRAAS